MKTDLLQSKQVYENSSHFLKFLSISDFGSFLLISEVTTSWSTLFQKASRSEAERV